MDNHADGQGNVGGRGAGGVAGSAWSERYAEKHRWRRLKEFPEGLRAPVKVRVYRRADHFILQWWEPCAKSNIAERVDGDLLAALVRARQIDERLADGRGAGPSRRRLSHAELAQRYLANLDRRADAGELSPASVRRYGAALGHYLAFVAQPPVARDYPHAATINRDFRLAFAAFLTGRTVSANGRAGTPGRPMKGQGLVRDTVRGMLEWAADPDRGGLLPEGFRNPFLRTGESRPPLQADPLAEPDITLPMALDFVRACDGYQLRLFVPLLLFGLRASEPCFLFREYLGADWLRVPCNPDLDYHTKGRRDKRFPLVDQLAPLWDALREGGPHGLLYLRREVLQGREECPWWGRPLADLVGEFRRRCAEAGPLTAAGRRRLRDGLLREAGGLCYDNVEQEFRVLARRLEWPARATLKDFRHLFCTMLASATLPDAYRQYLMGHAPGKAALVAYTHLPELRRHYAEAVRGEWAPLVEAVLTRLETCRPA